MTAKAKIVIETEDGTGLMDLESYEIHNRFQWINFDAHNRVPVITSTTISASVAKPVRFIRNDETITVNMERDGKKYSGVLYPVEEEK